MTSDQQRKALVVIGNHIRAELRQSPVEPRPEIERALRRLLERDIAERSRPQRVWTGKGPGPH
jgi:hypothetical protein